MVSIFSIFLMLLSSESYSLRGAVIIWLFTILISGISPILFWLLMIVEAFKKYPNRIYGKAFLISLLSYPIAFFIYVALFFYSSSVICQTTEYISPSGQKSISILVTFLEGKTSGTVMIKKFVFNKYGEIIDLPQDWSESYRKTTLPLNSPDQKEENWQLCDNFKKKTEVKWLDNENQIQIKTKSNKNSQVHIIKLSTFSKNPNVFV
jgi:hypothetical protein